MPNYRIIPLGGGGLPSTTKYGASISMTMDEDYVLTLQLIDQDGNNLGSSQSVDLPLESVVVNGSYDSTNKKLILTLDNGNTIDIPIGGLISGLQEEITSDNKLSADLIADGTTNKVFTAADKTKLDGIEAGAEVNVQSDWNATEGDALILNKPTIPAAQVNSDWNAATGVAEILNKPANLVQDVSYVHTDNNFTTAEKTKLDGIAAGAEVNVQSDWNATEGDALILNKPDLSTKQDTLTAGENITIENNVISATGGSNAWYGTQAEFDAIATKDADTDYFISDKIDYNTEIKNAPDLSSYATKSELDTKTAEQDVELAGKISGQFMTQEEFNSATKKEGENYFIEGSTIEVVVTFTDQTTATYNVVVD